MADFDPGILDRYGRDARLDLSHYCGVDRLLLREGPPSQDLGVSRQEQEEIGPQIHADKHRSEKEIASGRLAIFSF